MITKDEFSELLTGEQDLMLKQLDGLSHADSLLQPQPGGNCLNWVMGHLVENLAEILSVLGGEPPAGLPNLDRFGFGSEPVCGKEADLIELPALRDAHGLLTGAIGHRLTQMTEADFDEEIEFWQGTRRRGYIAFFYFFHHTYHIGQLEQLRNLAGRTDKVI